MFFNVFSIVFLIICIIAFYLHYFKNGKKIFCIISGIVYFLLAALRSSVVGGDTEIYVSMFRSVAKADWKIVIANEEKDSVFWGMLSALGKLTTDYTVLFAIIAAFFTISVWYFIYKYSKDPLLSVIVLLAMNLYQFSLTGMRQTIAMSFIIWAIILLDRNRIKTAILFVLMAALFHASALIFLVAIVVKKIKFNHLTFVISVPILTICFLFRENLANGLILLIDERGYKVENTGNGLTMALVICALYILAIVYARNYIEENKSLYLQYGIAAIAVFFELLVPAQSIYFRIAFYFLMIYIILIPNVLCSIKNKRMQVLVRTIVYILLIIQYLGFTVGSCYILPYTTFWQTI